MPTIPAILRVLLVFVLILAAIRKKVSLGNAFFFGALILGLLFSMPPDQIALSVLGSLTEAKTVSLAVIVSLILVLSHSLEEAGQMERLLTNFQGLVRTPRINLVVFPALIGLLPMPGGAIFSAPMVKTLGEKLRLSADQLSYINYWFRHIWEYWWPLYPGVLLTTTLADLDLWVFVLCLFPMTLVAVAGGYWSLKIPSQNPNPAGTPEARAPRPPIRPFLKELAPIAGVIFGGLGLGSILSLVLPDSVTVSKEMGLIAALAAVILWVWHRNGIPWERRAAILRRRQLLQMFYMVASILIFKGILEDSDAVRAMSQELLAWRIPLIPITVILPFLVGTVVGITIAFVGSTFPILISLVQGFGEAHWMLGYMMLALAAGFVGVLLSPLHLCLLLSNEYFGTSLGRVFRYLLRPCALLLLCSLAYFWMLHRML
ncbi:hypothetical protein SAMN02746041_02978 [Desulfacinum hydrothermale DSM 13146]|uniref:DUF401 family protein n=1 Tax=Desulfacinum hydrothermale DSM 13146 TaxID=1121390 RepID=A0A1W1XU32_9BACT|nr:DUF401 family protein [Desulfacinum hydrothermale]SMC27490.1 hypothetical protein SAMN02746041_02978 [Desulfacinum hydrothermale DSM 13146]